MIIMLEISVEPFLDAFVLIYHLLALISSIQFRIIRFVSDHGSIKSCCCKLVAKHKEEPMVLASDISQALISCRDNLRPGYVHDLTEKSRLPIIKDEKFKLAQTSVANLFYTIQDQKKELSIILDNLTVVFDILHESDPSLALWDEFRTVVPLKLDMLIMNLSKIMVSFQIPLYPIPRIQLGHHFFIELGRSIFQKNCKRLNESMLKTHPKGYHRHHDDTSE